MAQVRTMQLHTRYASLPASFHAPATPQPPLKPQMLLWNTRTAQMLGLPEEGLNNPQMLECFSGVSLPEGCVPVAQAYAGHQFGHFVSSLGDGRALLLGEIQSPQGVFYDIHLKGIGRTPFSRQGDGLYALGPAIREYLMAEAMHRLGIPTTHVLCVAHTGRTVFRPHPSASAVLTRVAPTHIRVGTFEYQAFRSNTEGLRALVQHVSALFTPMPTNTYELLQNIAQQWCSLTAHWMRVGFVHGVMNTDNAHILGHTLDYGPCAFMDAYNPDTVFSSIDQQARYAFAQQPAIAQWNYARLLESLLAVLHETPSQALEQAQHLLAFFNQQMHDTYWDMMRKKCGLYTAQPNDLVLIKDLLNTLHTHALDHTQSFRHLADIAEGAEPKSPFKTWVEQWKQRLNNEPACSERAHTMRRYNPAYIPRNSLVEKALHGITEENTWDTFHALMESMQDPYTESAAHTAFHNTFEPSQTGVFPTFCGT
jgi:uncharacterized protein YdiU (UPF0061 family)